MFKDPLFPEEEMDEENRMLVKSLRHLYNTRNDDAQSLAHIRTRLLQIAEGDLPVISNEASRNTLPLSPQPHTNRQDVSNIFLEKKPWSRHLTLLVAVLSIILVVGPLALLFASAHHSNTGGNSNINLRPGWQAIATYSGTGKKTFTDLGVKIPRLWATSLSCSGSGNVTITLLSQKQSEEQDGTNDCSVPWSTLPAPNYFIYVQNAKVIQTVQVQADDTTTWHLSILQAIRQPTFALGTEWSSQNVYMSGNAINFTKSAHQGWQMTPNNIETGTFSPTTTAQAQTWGLVTTCFGTSKKSWITLDPAIGSITMPICDGQPKLTVLRFSRITHVTSVTVHASGDIIWGAYIAACTDETRCNNISATSTTLQATPNSTPAP